MILLSACATSLQRPQSERFLAYQDRAQQIQALDHWTLTGRLALNDSEDGGSGRFSWDWRENFSQLDFRAALGKGTWRISVEPEYAWIESGDGGRADAGTVHELLEQQIGWPVPVDALRWWVLGMAEPGVVYSRMDLDELGRILFLEQQGWHIAFSRYKDEPPFLPGRVIAEHAEYQVKLIVSQWQTEGADG